MARSQGELVEIGGHRMRLTHPDKVLYPETGTTKADVIGYYVQIAPFMLPHVAGRPATRKRWVDGVDGSAGVPGRGRQQGTVFFEKNLPDSAPSWIRRTSIQHRSGRNTYPVIDSVAALAWMGQQAALELHVPQWRVGAHGKQLDPDRFVLDLDPGPGAGLPECVEVAHRARELLGELGLEAFPVTSGSKGLHLYAGLEPSTGSGNGTRHDADYVNAFAKQFAQALESELPDLVVSSQKKSLRGGKVLADWSQNNRNKTTIAPYSLRGRAQPTVAVPRTWDELDDPDLRHLTLDEVLERMAERDDPLAPLGVEVAGEESDDVPDKLTIYRSKRDASKTPEPVPDAGGGAGPRAAEGTAFVIQEHHATRLHHDFRLERDGVLVSWAVPKGVPPTTRKNHLAVPTEDHPMEYASFEGEIPRGEYGGGTVTIWDAGTYETEKWRDDEVIVVLHGRGDGGLRDIDEGRPVKVALIRTGDNWLMHRMELDGTKKKTPTRPRSAPGRPTPVETPERPELDRIEPMLAKAGAPTDVDDEDDWAFEMKWDGVRVVAYVDGPAVELRGRSGRDMTATYPEVVEALAGLELPGAVVDGEVVAIDDDGAPSFSRLQERMLLTKPRDVAAARSRVEVTFLAFDVLRLDGHGLANTPYEDRRALLQELDLDVDHVSTPEAFTGSLAEAMDASLDLRLEGVVAKRRSSRYLSGRRSSSWVKLKHQRMQEVVVVGWRPGKGERAGGIGSLLVAVHDDGELVYVGRVGSGLRDADLRRLESLLRPLERRTAPVEVERDVAREAHWVTPRVVGEVSYGEMTGSGHLRHPVWRGLRADREPADAVRETDS